MAHFMRNFRRFNKSSLLPSPSVAIAVPGSTLLCCNNNYVNSYRASPVPSPDITKEYSGAVHDGSKPCGCFCRDSIANAAAKVGPAVVNIVVPLEFTVGRGIGSGTIINKDGTILTCAHVVDGSVKGKVEVTLQDGRTFVGKVIHADQHSDIAMVKINSETPLPEAKLGSSSRLRPGDWVIAMGCPLSLQNTVTAGIVSYVNRKSCDMGLTGLNREYLQTDCAINLGNSGGPLVNIDGEVVGVNVMKVQEADGLGFSVPSDVVSKIIEHFNKSGYVISGVTSVVAGNNPWMLICNLRVMVPILQMLNFMPSARSLML